MRGQRNKHIPQRTCLVCRETKPKRQLTRLVRVDNQVAVDPTGKMSGRGAYLCDTGTCMEHALTTDVIGRALRVTLTEEDIVQLSVDLEAVRENT